MFEAPVSLLLRGRPDGNPASGWVDNQRGPGPVRRNLNRLVHPGHASPGATGKPLGQGREACGVEVRVGPFEGCVLVVDPDALQVRVAPREPQLASAVRVFRGAVAGAARDGQDPNDDNRQQREPTEGGCTSHRPHTIRGGALLVGGRAAPDVGSRRSGVGGGAPVVGGGVLLVAGGVLLVGSLGTAAPRRTASESLEASRCFPTEGAHQPGCARRRGPRHPWSGSVAHLVGGRESIGNEARWSWLFAERCVLPRRRAGFEKWFSG